MDLFHYTNKDNWNAIRSQTVWRFRASQPPSNDRPFGAYFTDVPPTKENLRQLSKRLRIPRIKLGYVFWFSGNQGLEQLRHRRARDRWIYYSPVDYEVEPGRQTYNGETPLDRENFP